MILQKNKNNLIKINKLLFILASLIILFIIPTSLSAKIKLDRLLSGLQLGDKKPSQLLREMQSLATDQISEPVLTNLWLQRLPTHAQEILSCMESAELTKISIAADKILDVCGDIS